MRSTPTDRGHVATVAAAPKAAARRETPRAATVKLATSAVVDVLTTATAFKPSTKHPFLERFGETLGLGLGLIVTEALAAVPSWNTPVLDAKGKPVAEVAGAKRVGTHAIRKRHEEFVGPKVAALVEKMPPSALRDILDGFAQGATAAPGTSYRLESAFDDLATAAERQHRAKRKG
ncbi:MAG: hypothetical protein JNG84_11235 [Archangium sp.]|nr:hypothetical protein [Archangium sp.]